MYIRLGSDSLVTSILVSSTFACCCQLVNASHGLHIGSATLAEHVS